MEFRKSAFWIPFLSGLAGVLLLAGCQADDVAPPGPPDPGPGGEVVTDALPLFRIDTRGVAIVDEPKIDADMEISDDGDLLYQGPIGVEYRGATSQLLFPKKSLGFETRDQANEDLNVPLLGYPEEEDWILYGPYSDKSLMRNVLIYDLSRAIGRYASRTRFVELEVNGVPLGVYVFMEKIKRDKNRVDLSKLNPDENTGEDLTGGYILKIDKLAGNNLGEGYNPQNSFPSSYAPSGGVQGQVVHFLYEEPDAEDISAQQRAYISNYVGSFELALASEDFADPLLGYEAYIDTDSFIDFFLLNELAHNVDAYRLSTFMHKDKNGKLAMGPIWDFNIAFGNANYCGGERTDVWAYRFNERCPEDFWLVPFWWERLLESPEFTNRLRQRWEELRASHFSGASIRARVEGYAELLADAGALETNFAIWPVLGTYVWPNQFIGQTHAQEVEYLLSWIDARLAWMDQAITNL